MIAVCKDRFVEEHRVEIEREAFQLYVTRRYWCQPDDPAENFLVAIERVKAHYRHNEGGENAGQFVS